MPRYALSSSVLPPQLRGMRRAADDGTTQVVWEAHRDVWVDAVRASPRISF
jgi:hypothetical protein